MLKGLPYDILKQGIADTGIMLFWSLLRHIQETEMVSRAGGDPSCLTRAAAIVAS